MVNQNKIFSFKIKRQAKERLSKITAVNVLKLTLQYKLWFNIDMRTFFTWHLAKTHTSMHIASSLFSDLCFYPRAFRKKKKNNPKNRGYCDTPVRPYVRL